MKYIIFLLIFLTSCTGEKVLDSSSVENISAEIISIDGRYGNELKINNDGEEFFIDVKDIKPWKIDFCNVDGGEKS